MNQEPWTQRRRPIGHPWLQRLRVVLATALTCAAAMAGERWSSERAQAWAARQPWIVGCNYVPTYAINQIDTWQAESFAPAVIDRELGWAEALGFNTVRVFLHDLPWAADPAGFKRRFDTFLGLCAKHHLRAVPTFFTNGVYGYQGEPHLGPQEPPSPTNSGWVQSPGAVVVNDPAQWARLEAYIKDVVGTFAADERILLWSLYNEPESTKKGARSLPLLRQVFAWARSVNPSQPLSAPIWKFPNARSTHLDVVSFLGEHCDVITFHCYGDAAEMKAFIQLLRPFGRPLVCTEYLKRPVSTITALLPLLRAEGVGALNWGLAPYQRIVALRRAGVEPALWRQHLLRPDGTPIDAAEIALIRELTASPRPLATPPVGQPRPLPPPPTSPFQLHEP